MQLCLGTVQFGMDYGIRNQKKPTLEESIKILDYATQNGVDNIDTANAYGTAEDVVGEFLKRKTIDREKLFIISKFRPNLLDDIKEEAYYEVMKKNLENTLQRLGVDYLDSYLLHSARYVYNEAILETLAGMKKEGYVRNVGVSVYEIDEAIKCIESNKTNFMQLPYSIFDQRMKAGGVFDIAKKATTQIHSRSAFIQGLILMKEEEIPPFLEKAKPIIRKIDKICKMYGLSRIELAIGFVKKQEEISHLVFGVDNIEQLREDIEVFQRDLSNDLIESIANEFRDIETDIVMPSLWKR